MTNSARDISVSALIERRYHQHSAAKIKHITCLSSDPFCPHISLLSGLFCLQWKHLALWIFHNMGFHGETLLAPRPIPKLEDHPSSAVRDCLFNLFAATLHIGGRSSIRNEDAPCRGDRDPLITWLHRTHTHTHTHTNKIYIHYTSRTIITYK